MNPRTATTSVPVLVREPSPPEMDLDAPADRLLRVRPEVYRGMVEHRLIADAEVTLVDGLLRRGEGLYRMPLEVYDRVAALGLLGPEDQTELLDGLLVKKMTKGDSHIFVAYMTREALAAVVPRGWFVLKEDPVALPAGPSGQASEPEPDVMVVGGTIREYLAHKRPASAVALVVEVSESSLGDDRKKLARYAWANIPVAWLVNVTDRTVEVHTRPTGPTVAEGAAYQEVVVHGEADDLPVTIDGREVGRIPTRDVLP